MVVLAALSNKKGRKACTSAAKAAAASGSAKLRATFICSK
jgi:hypothetical protein